MTNLSAAGSLLSCQTWSAEMKIGLCVSGLCVCMCVFYAGCLVHGERGAVMLLRSSSSLGAGEAWETDGRPVDGC